MNREHFTHSSPTPLFRRGHTPGSRSKPRSSGREPWSAKVIRLRPLKKLPVQTPAELACCKARSRREILGWEHLGYMEIEPAELYLSLHNCPDCRTTKSVYVGVRELWDEAWRVARVHARALAMKIHLNSPRRHDGIVQQAVNELRESLAKQPEYFRMLCTSAWITLGETISTPEGRLWVDPLDKNPPHQRCTKTLSQHVSQAIAINKLDKHSCDECGDTGVVPNRQYDSAWCGCVQVAIEHWRDDVWHHVKERIQATSPKCPWHTRQSRRDDRESFDAHAEYWAEQRAEGFRV